MRTREQILELLKEFCRANGLILSGTVEADLAVTEAGDPKSGSWMFYPGVGPNGEL